MTDVPVQVVSAVGATDPAGVKVDLSLIVQTTAPPPTPDPTPPPTGDSIQDAFARFAAGDAAVIRPGDYEIDAPLTATFAQHCLGATLIADGVRIISHITDGRSVVRLSVQPGIQVRAPVVRGLTIIGSGQDGHGFLIEADGNDRAFYEGLLERIKAESCGGDGIHLEGSVFETALHMSGGMNNKHSGLVLMHSANGGICSAIRVTAGSFAQNAEWGAACWGYQSGVMQDLAMWGSYIRDNGLGAVSAPGGLRSLHSVGAENNWRSAVNPDGSLKSGQPAVRPAFALQIRGSIEACLCNNNSGGQNCMFDAYTVQNGSLYVTRSTIEGSAPDGLFGGAVRGGGRAVIMSSGLASGFRFADGMDARTTIIE